MQIGSIQNINIINNSLKSKRANNISNSVLNNYETVAMGYNPTALYSVNFKGLQMPLVFANCANYQLANVKEFLKNNIGKDISQNEAHTIRRFEQFTQGQVKSV